MKELKLCQLKNIKNMRFKPLQALNLYIQIPLVRHSYKTRMNITKTKKSHSERNATIHKIISNYIQNSILSKKKLSIHRSNPL